MSRRTSVAALQEVGRPLAGKGQVIGGRLYPVIASDVDDLFVDARIDLEVLARAGAFLKGDDSAVGKGLKSPPILIITVCLDRTGIRHSVGAQREAHRSKMHLELFHLLHDARALGIRHPEIEHGPLCPLLELLLAHDLGIEEHHVVVDFPSLTGQKFRSLIDYEDRFFHIRLGLLTFLQGLAGNLRGEAQFQAIRWLIVLTLKRSLIGGLEIIAGSRLVGAEGQVQEIFLAIGELNRVIRRIEAA